MILDRFTDGNFNVHCIIMYMYVFTQSCHSPKKPGDILAIIPAPSTGRNTGREVDFGSPYPENNEQIHRQR